MPISLVILVIGIQDLYTSKYKYTISIGNTLLQSVASRSLDIQKGSANEVTYQDRDGHD